MFNEGKSPFTLTAVCLAVALTGACSSSDSDPVEKPGEVPSDGGAGNPNEGEQPNVNGDVKTMLVDASAGGFGAADDDPANRWSYLNLATGELLALTDQQAESSKDWHMAFKRVGIRINGGSSGPGEVTAAVIDDQAEFYSEQGEPVSSVFEQASAQSELAALEQSVDTSQLPFESDRYVASINGNGQDTSASWWLYDRVNHSVNANPDVWSVVRGSSGESFAKLHVTDIQQADRQISIEMWIQPEGADAFAASPVVWTAAIGMAGGSLCYDFEQMMQVDCTAQASFWDLQVEVSNNGQSWNLWTNGGVVRGDGAQGASFGPLSAALQEQYTGASSVPTWFEDDTAGVFHGSPWYEYNLQGSHRIWPNYRVYAVNTPDGDYKVQLLGYYDEAGASGHITLRYSVMD